MEYYAAFKRKDILTQATTWVNIEVSSLSILTLSETNHNFKNGLE